MMTASKLDKSISPFLREAQDQAVAWRPWSDAVMEEAKEAGKPIFLSIGYQGSHLSEAMAQESFRDAETAALINDNFIPVLVDREERPEIDQLYQAASNVMNHAGGWPLNIFLTSEGVPFYATGYMAREERIDRPSFRRLLNEMIRLTREQPDEVATNSATVMDRLNQIFSRDTRGTLDSIQLEMGAIRIGQRYDIFMGGLTGATKFPSTALLEVLWRAYLRNGVPQFMQLVSATLNNVLLGGLYDHVGGGFFRYTNDERWMTPHFEKTLCDNALLLNILTQLWQFNRNDLSRQRIADTVGWLLRDMTLEGAFAAGQSAASEGEEGKYYVWTESEIDAALQGTFSARFKQVYGVRSGEFGGRTILNRFASVGQISDADEALMARQRAMLLEVRAKRTKPQREEILLADWNGLAIRALAFAGAAFEKPDWVQAAVKAFDVIVKLMDQDGTLAHAWANGARGGYGLADDYVQMAAAAIQLYEVTGRKDYLEKARGWVRTLDAQFWDDARGGYYQTPQGADRLIIRSRMIFDQPMPSANSSMIGILTKLALLTGENDYGMRAQAILQAFAGEFGRNWISAGEYLNGFETFAAGLQLVVVGKSTDTGTDDLIRAIWGKALPNRLLVRVENTEDLPGGHPLFGKTTPNGMPAVYVCQRNVCSPPVTSAQALSQMLTLPQAQPAGTA